MLEIDYDRYEVPRQIHSRLSQLRFKGRSPQIHTVKLSNGKQIDLYARLAKSETLIVSFHGAYSASKPGTYPMFWRISSLQKKTNAFVAFTDPTRLEGKGDILISWFLGKDGWDPMPTILNIIEKAMDSCGAKRVLFVGGSGGGFVALRASAEIPGSCAFVQDATVGLTRHNTKIVQGYFEKAWPGWDSEKLLEGFPEHFNMHLYYMRRAPKNFVYMTQSKQDKAHLSQHLVPFARAHGIPTTGGTNHDKNRVIRVYEPQRPGHGKITAQEFNSFYEDCMKAWLEWESEKRNAFERTEIQPTQSQETNVLSKNTTPIAQQPKPQTLFRMLRGRLTRTVKRVSEFKSQGT